jgi:hypothetical protein
VPATAPAFISIDTDPGSSQWETVDALATKFPDKGKAVDALKKSLRQDSKVDWEKDVKPALGKEADFVWLDFEKGGDNFVGLMQPQDQAAFERLIAKGNASAKKPSDKVAHHKFRGWEVLASDRATIDRFENESDSAAKMLSDESAFKQSMNRLGGDAIVRAYVNGELLTKLVRQQAGPQLTPYLDKAGKLDWIALKVAARSDGIGLDTIVHGTLGKLFAGVPQTPSFSPKLLGSVPKDALFYLSFHGSKNMLAALKKNALLDTPAYRGLERSLADVGRILEGENALYLRPGSGRLPGYQFDIPELTLIATPRKGTDGARVLDLLVDRELGTPPSFATIAGLPARKIAEGGVGLFYANVDGKLVVTDLAAGIRSVKNGGKPLSESESFRDASRASGLPSKINALLYVDIHSTVPLAEKLSQSRVPAEIAKNLKPLRSAVQYVASRTHELQLTFFLQIK